MITSAALPRSLAAHSLLVPLLRVGLPLLFAFVLGRLAARFGTSAGR
jgi:hypothetical protein